MQFKTAYHLTDQIFHPAKIPSRTSTSRSAPTSRKSFKQTFGRELPLLFPGQVVWVHDPKSKRLTKTGKVINFGVNDREYLQGVSHQLRLGV
jgi:hypothetical protein